MNDFYKNLGPLAAQIANRVGPATYRSAMQRYMASTPSGWMDVSTFLKELERQTDVHLTDLTPRETSLAGRSRARITANRLPPGGETDRAS